MINKMYASINVTNDLKHSFIDNELLSPLCVAVHKHASSGFDVSFKCHNVTIMKNAQGDRVIIQEVK